jgi:hypothetical protein
MLTHILLSHRALASSTEVLYNKPWGSVAFKLFSCFFFGNLSITTLASPYFQEKYDHSYTKYTDTSGQSDHTNKYGLVQTKDCFLFSTSTCNCKEIIREIRIKT